MIRFITGTVLDTSPLGVIIQIGGIGVFVYTPPSALVPGDTATLHTHLAVRETALDLYGFADTRSLTMFELLLSVPKIGPKSALQILSNCSVEQLIAAISTEDVTLIANIPGLRGKTGTSVVTHLRGKVDHLHSDNHTIIINPLVQEAIEVLQSLGFSYESARERATALSHETDLSSIIRQALTK
jgi:Holliday junction DNA helicase RuvA